jgi:ribA/ribD-fused uncharacterized protein
MDRLYYFSRSADKYPGKGSNEYVKNPNDYLELSKIADWRKMLSNFWVAPFDINGVRFNTVEHAYQGSKIGIADPDLGHSFSLNTGSELSQSSGDVAQKNRKLVVLNSDQLTKWQLVQDELVYQALVSKFSQNPDLREVLLFTNDAELWHGAPRVKPNRQYILEKVRAELLE